MDRDHLPEPEAQKRISAQMPLSEKCDRSNFVVDNSATRGETRHQVDKIISNLKASRHYINVRFYLIGLAISFTFVLSCILYVIYFLISRRFS